jgi:hypothetical protein
LEGVHYILICLSSSRLLEQHRPHNFMKRNPLDDFKPDFNG